MFRGAIQKIKVVAYLFMAHDVCIKIIFDLISAVKSKKQQN